MPDVAIALSGGVDSSVAAALLIEQGRDVFGVTMRLGLAEIAGRPCCGEEEVALARRVCATLGIPHVVIDVADEFDARVVQPFCDAYAAGLTPNPCVLCNQHVKLGHFAGRVRMLGATTLATGHYARLRHDAGETWLERAVDAEKDQSYFLYRVEPAVLETLEFPLGEFTKAEVRAMAAERGLPTAERRESQEVCFTNDHASLVGQRHPEALAPGPIEDASGRRLGTHRGIARYTIGQRKGLGVGGPDGPYRVLAIDTARNALTVGPDPETRDVLTVGPVPETRDTGILLADPVWRLGPGTHEVTAYVRYHGTPVRATGALGESGLSVVFASPVERPAPGQSVVLYQDDRVVGGGIVTLRGTDAYPVSALP